MEWECFWVILREENKVSESNMAEIQDGCHHQVKWEWMSLSQIELVWVQSQNGVRVFLSESEVKITMVSECKMAVYESNMAEFKMAAIIKLSQNEWVKFFFVQIVGTNLGKCEWVSEENLRWLNPRWQNSRWQNSRWLPSSSWMRMNEFESDWISLGQSQNGVRVFLSESERRSNESKMAVSESNQDGRIQDGQRIQDESIWLMAESSSIC